MMLRRLYESPFVRFAVVGGVATAVNYAVYVVLVRCFDDLWPALAYFCAFCVSIVCNFLLSSYFTFRVRPSARRAVRFLTAHLINLVNELVLLEIWLWAGVPKLYAPLCVFRLSGQFPDGALRPARAFEILKKRTLPCDARQGLLLHLFGCSLGYFLILGSSSPYFFFRSSALSHSPSSIASTPHATKISIGRV
jgi:putative flippase GtrA